MKLPFSALLLAASFGVLAGNAAAQTALKIDAPHLFQPIPGLPAAGYLDVTANGFGDRILSASSPVADSISIKSTQLDADGIAMMRTVKEVALADGETVRFERDGLQLILNGLEGDFAPGDRIPVTLTLADSGDINVELKVFARGQRIVSDSNATTSAVAEAEPAQIESSSTDITDRLTAGVAIVRDRATDLLDGGESALENAGETAAVLRDRGRETLKASKQGLSTLSEEVGTGLQDARQSVTQSVTEIIDNRGEIAASAREGAAGMAKDAGTAIAQGGKGFWGRLKDGIRAD